MGDKFFLVRLKVPFGFQIWVTGNNMGPAGDQYIIFDIIQMIKETEQKGWPVSVRSLLSLDGFC